MVVVAIVVVDNVVEAIVFVVAAVVDVLGQANVLVHRRIVVAAHVQLEAIVVMNSNSDTLRTRTALHCLDMMKVVAGHCSDKMMKMVVVEHCPDNLMKMAVVEHCPDNLMKMAVEHCPDNLMTMVVVEHCPDNLMKMVAVEHCPDNLMTMVVVGHCPDNRMMMVVGHCSDNRMMAVVGHCSDNRMKVVAEHCPDNRMMMVVGHHLVMELEPFGLGGRKAVMNLVLEVVQVILEALVPSPFEAQEGVHLITQP